MNRMSKLGTSFQFDNLFHEHPLELTNYKIHQIGELCCEGGYQVYTHTQICHELSVILSGTGVFICDGIEYPVKKGDVIVNPLGTMHTIRADTAQQLRFFYLGFHFKDPTQEPHCSLEQFFSSLRIHKASAPPEIDTYLFAVLDEFYNEKVGFHTMVNAYVEQIILMTRRAFTEMLPEKYAPNLDKNSIGNSAYAVVRYVDKNILKITDIKSVATELGYSYTYLSHMFKKKTNVTLQHYIGLRRMEWAKQMLSEQGMSITQVSDTLGYETIQSFSRAFRRIIGQSPAAYVKKTKKDS